MQQPQQQEQQQQQQQQQQQGAEEEPQLQQMEDQQQPQQQEQQQPQQEDQQQPQQQKAEGCAAPTTEVEGEAATAAEAANAAEAVKAAEAAAAEAAAAAAAEAAAEERRKKEQRKNDEAAVAEAIQELEGLPATARQMLGNGLPHAVPAANAGEGAAVAFTGLVADSFDGELRRLAASTEECIVAQREAEQQMLRLESAVIDAIDASKAKAEELDAKVAASGDAAEAVKAEEMLHQQAEKVSKGQLQAWQEARDARTRAAAISEGPLRALAEGGTVEGGDKAAATASVLELVADKVLCAAAAPALAAAPEERKPFDTLVVGEVAKTIDEQISEFDRDIAEFTPQEAQAKAEVLGAWALADVARDALAAAERTAQEAKVASQQALLAVEVAQEEVKGQKRKSSELAIRLVLNEANGAKVRKGLAALARLTGKAEGVAEEQKEPPSAPVDVEMTNGSGKEAMASPAHRNPFGVATPAATL